jgi:hypothetical protein
MRLDQALAQLLAFSVISYFKPAKKTDTVKRQIVEIHLKPFSNAHCVDCFKYSNYC